MSALAFYPGIHQPSDCRHMDRSFVSVNRLVTRKSDFVVADWIMDSGAFTQVTKHGDFTMSVEEYAGHIARWSQCGNLECACTQDYMCEEPALAATARVLEPDLDGPMSIEDHQRLTIERYKALKAALAALGCETDLMPVLQGQSVEDYVFHLWDYEHEGLIPEGCRVGVGSVCKRNAYPQEVVVILRAIKDWRPDIRLHGFGLKITALSDPEVRDLLYSSDSMAWSVDARHTRNRIRKRGGDPNTAPSPNDWRAAAAYVDRVQQLIDQ